ncbi:hypothetical protein ACTXT7_000492 [Hymenolepis weldensis]
MALQTSVAHRNGEIKGKGGHHFLSEYCVSPSFYRPLAFLGLKLILIVYPRHALAKSRYIIASLAKLAFYRCCGVQLWKFLDFIVTNRPSIFMHMAPFFRFQVLNFPCETQGEQAFQQIIGQKLIGLHLPPQQTIVSLLKELLLDLRTLREEKQASFYSVLISIWLRFLIVMSIIRFSDAQSDTSETPIVSKSSPASRWLYANITAQHSSERHFGMLEGGQIRPFSQVEFRQSLLRRTSGKRITAHDGKMIDPDPQRPSVESLPRQSGPPGALEKRHKTIDRNKGEVKRAMTSTGRIDRSTRGLSNLANPTLSSRDDDAEDDDTKGGVEELNAPVNPIIAAAVATSLYGSAAPYTQVREKAREELPDLIGVTEPPEPLSSRRRASTNPMQPPRSSRLIDNIPLVDLHVFPSTSFPTSPAAPPAPPPPKLEGPLVDVSPTPLPANQDQLSHTDTPKKINYV